MWRFAMMLKVLGAARALLLATFVAGAIAVLPGKAFAVGWSCNIYNVSEILGTNARIGVLCLNPMAVNNGGTTQTIQFLSFATTHASANRFINMANAAMLAGKALVVDIPTASTGNNAGCDAANCRTPTTFGIGP
jgi:hypothetical protein